jgi:epoxide hydrolase-like predicted phosphatase
VTESHSGGFRALVLDYGGVLTSPLWQTMAAWCDGDGIDPREFRRIMREWLADSGDDGSGAAANPAHALERGELAADAFERELAARLRTRGGAPVQAEGLLTRMFAGFGRDEPMVDVVRRARRSGVKCALLSNSWGLDYDRVGWDELFDVVVVSGEVGMRKPEERIYRLTAERLGVAPGECVFVDDLAPNVRGAVAAGMVAVHHVSVEQTVAELAALFGDELAA